MASEQDLDLDDITSTSQGRCPTAAPGPKSKSLDNPDPIGGLSLNQLQEKANQVITYEWVRTGSRFSNIRFPPSSVWSNSVSFTWPGQRTHVWLQAWNPGKLSKDGASLPPHWRKCQEGRQNPRVQVKDHLISFIWKNTNSFGEISILSCLWFSFWSHNAFSCSSCSQSLSTLTVIEEFLAKRPVPPSPYTTSKDRPNQNWVRNLNYYSKLSLMSLSAHFILIIQITLT